MTALNRTTRRRLQQLPQIPGSVWEGDRRILSAGLPISRDSDLEEGECILWVDGLHSLVRAMDVVVADIGPEATVRTLIRAMEQPHSPAKPSRPQKIVVSDRETQFFLRGVLQDLDINVEYVTELPLIDEIFRSFQEIAESRTPQLPPQYAELLTNQATQIWQDAPWSYLEEHQILAIELNQWDVSHLYASIMGMLGMEYGILLYRSLDSLKQFRELVLGEQSMEAMEEAFLKQDCLFITFEATDDLEDEMGGSLAGLAASDVQPVFGNLHPLEGLRSFLHDEEAQTLLVTLETLHRFFKQHRKKFAKSDFPAITSQYKIPLPLADQALATTDLTTPDLATPLPSSISVKVTTLPEVSTELLALDDGEDDFILPLLQDDLVPSDRLLSLGMISWEVVYFLRETAKFYQSTDQEIPEKGEGLPIILIQTSLPKAKVLIQKLQAAGGVQAVCFNPGSDPQTQSYYDLCLLQTGDEKFHLCGEFLERDPVHIAARKKWNRRCKSTKGHCGVLVAKGLKGASRGNPVFRDMLALFEAKAFTGEELGISPLQLTRE